MADTYKCQGNANTGAQNMGKTIIMDLNTGKARWATADEQARADRQARERARAESARLDRLESLEFQGALTADEQREIFG